MYALTPYVLDILLDNEFIAQKWAYTPSPLVGMEDGCPVGRDVGNWLLKVASAQPIKEVKFPNIPSPL